MTKPRAVVNETWRRMEKELLLRVQQKLDTMTKPIAETSLLVRTMQHRLSVWSRPHEVLWPLALVWLALISVWLMYKVIKAPSAPGRPSAQVRPYESADLSLSFHRMIYLFLLRQVGHMAVPLPL
ncbi:hypothetical protein H257_08517 [Aphanomyces astaci]|uniref:Uncharacterized protein n=1 Tax=Aphanomyces astaci TaxID=112090 RepID=W4GEC8_APHAT|nr:hypothetical protein H257_08517 [Aphanomyces astaci]ETV77606.1 hypothetical protein H257_08517 [Aphanomyces astaci]|eukprot:XP_009832716.1 hypothetical protein H257_08517 [Aphanomyces astaci]